MTADKKFRESKKFMFGVIGLSCIMVINWTATPLTVAVSMAAISAVGLIVSIVAGVQGAADYQKQRRQNGAEE